MPLFYTFLSSPLYYSLPSILSSSPFFPLITHSSFLPISSLLRVFLSFLKLILSGLPNFCLRLWNAWILYESCFYLLPFLFRFLKLIPSGLPNFKFLWECVDFILGLSDVMAGNYPGAQIVNPSPLPSLSPSFFFFSFLSSYPCCVRIGRPNLAGGGGGDNKF